MNYGVLSPSMVGVGMKEIVRRIMQFLYQERFAFEVKTKRGYDGQLNDVQTSGDTKAQEIYVEYLQENFPGYGIIAEEGDLYIPCTFDFDDWLFFSIDPLCGSKAFARKQSHGIATMFSLFSRTQFIAAYVGDVMTREVYGFRPESNKVHRISEFDIAELLEINPCKGQEAILLREIPSSYNEETQQLISHFDPKKILVADGSIGLSTARLWKNEMLVHIIPGGKYDTPWDNNPVCAISQKMGFGFYRIIGGKLDEVEYKPIFEKRRRDFDLIIAHESVLAYLR